LNRPLKSLLKRKNARVLPEHHRQTGSDNIGQRIVYFTLLALVWNPGKYFPEFFYEAVKL